MGIINTDISAHQIHSPAGAVGAGGIDTSQLARIAHDWGYSCGIRNGHPPDAPPSPPDALLARGMLVSHELPSGLRLCVSDMTTVADNRRTGVLGRSLTIMLALEGTPHHYDIAGHGELTVGCCQALAITTPESIAMTGHFHAGDRTRYLVLQAHSDMLHDAELAEAVERHVRCPRFSPLPFGPRATYLARACFPEGASGLVGRLRMESCALELLALALGAFDERLPSQSANPREVERIIAVRNSLLAHLDQEHHLEDLARSAGMSVSAFKAKFTAVVGQPVFRFLREHRLERAWQGLSEEGWSVSQAAFYVGYRHPANFATAFRRRFGIVPTDLVRSRAGA